MNNTLSGVVELISFPIVILTIDRFGRRIILCCSLVIGGLSCLGSTAANMFADDIPGTRGYFIEKIISVYSIANIVVYK